MKYVNSEPVSQIPTDLSLNEKNAEFWNELCGTTFAHTLGITDHSLDSLKKYDEWFLNFYPYLPRHIPYSSMKGKKVLEVGLGYGTVSQQIGETGAIFTGLDIAHGPVAMANYRFRLHGLNGQSVRGSILDSPFGDSVFDFVVAIGSYHHTGNLQRAINETYRLLKPGGKLVLMVYSAYSYRRWIRAFNPTGRYFMWDRFGIGETPESSCRERAAYDVNLRKESAPFTSFVSRGRLAKMCGRFSKFHARLENVSQEGPLRWFDRKTLLNSCPQFLRLDIYASAQK